MLCGRIAEIISADNEPDSRAKCPVGMHGSLAQQSVFVPQKLGLFHE